MVEFDEIQTDGRIMCLFQNENWIIFIDIDAHAANWNNLNDIFHLYLQYN